MFYIISSSVCILVVCGLCSYDWVFRWGCSVRVCTRPVRFPRRLPRGPSKPHPGRLQSKNEYKPFKFFFRKTGGKQTWKCSNLNAKIWTQKSKLNAEKCIGTEKTVYSLPKSSLKTQLTSKNRLHYKNLKPEIQTRIQKAQKTFYLTDLPLQTTYVSTKRICGAFDFGCWLVTQRYQA